MNTTAPTVVEEYSFLIANFKTTHIDEEGQSEEVTLNIKVRYLYVTGLSTTAYPDFRDIASSIQDYLTNYPNKQEYWEVINKGLVLMVIGDYPALASVTSELEVMPTSTDDYFNACIATCKR
jgi:hypothetical protein